MTSATIDRRLGLTGGVAIKTPCVTVAVTNITLSGLQTVSGVALVSGNRVLVTGQTDATKNGIWVADTGSWTRDLDFNGYGDCIQGTIIPILSGGGLIFYQLSTSNPVIGGTALIFSILPYPATITDSQVNVVQSYVNAVIDSQNQKNQDTVSVFDFMPNAYKIDVRARTLTLDHSTYVRNAVNYLISVGGGNLLMPKGSYKITAAIGDTSNTGIYVPDGICIKGDGPGTIINPGANNTALFRCNGILGSGSPRGGGIKELAWLNPGGYTNCSGIRMAPTDESQTTTHSDIEFYNIQDITGRQLQEGLTLRPGPTVGAQDSYLYYNSFINLDLRNNVIGVWEKAPPTQPGGGPNANKFTGVRVGETGANTGWKIDAGDTNTYVACSVEGVTSGTSPNTTPTGLQIANNTASYGSNNNKFYGFRIEGTTLPIDNNNDALELRGINSFPAPSGYTVNGNFSAGASTIAITGGSYPVIQNLFVSFDSDIASGQANWYKVTTGLAAGNIVIEQAGLQNNISSGAVMRFQYYSNSGFLPAPIEMAKATILYPRLGTGRFPRQAVDFYSEASDIVCQVATGISGTPEFRIDAALNYGYYSFYKNSVLQWLIGSLNTSPNIINVLFGASPAIKFALDNSLSVPRFRVNNNCMDFGSTAPVAGAWIQGDIRFNTGVAAGQPEGWRCTVSGTPGTWTAMANH